MDQHTGSERRDDGMLSSDHGLTARMLGTALGQLLLCLLCTRVVYYIFNIHAQPHLARVHELGLQAVELLFMGSLGVCSPCSQRITLLLELCCVRVQGGSWYTAHVPLHVLQLLRTVCEHAFRAVQPVCVSGHRRGGGGHPTGR